MQRPFNIIILTNRELVIIFDLLITPILCIWQNVLLKSQAEASLSPPTWQGAETHLINPICQGYVFYSSRGLCKNVPVIIMYLEFSSNNSLFNIFNNDTLCWQKSLNLFPWAVCTTHYEKAKCIFNDHVLQHIPQRGRLYTRAATS